MWSPACCAAARQPSIAMAAAVSCGGVPRRRGDTAANYIRVRRSSLGKATRGSPAGQIPPYRYGRVSVEMITTVCAVLGTGLQRFEGGASFGFATDKTRSGFSGGNRQTSSSLSLT